MLDRLKLMEARYNEINELLTKPEILSDVKKLTELSKEQRSLEKVVNLFHEQTKLEESLADLKEMKKSDDKELAEMAELEYDEANKRIDEIAEEIKVLLLPKDPNDEKTLSLKLEVLLVVMRLISLLVTYLECTLNMLNQRVGRSK